MTRILPRPAPARAVTRLIEAGTRLAAQTRARRQGPARTAGSLRQSSTSALKPMRAASPTVWGSMIAASRLWASSERAVEASGQRKASASALPRGPSSRA